MQDSNRFSVEPVVAPDTADYAITEEDLPILMDEYDLLAKRDDPKERRKEKDLPSSTL